MIFYTVAYLEMIIVGFFSLWLYFHPIYLDIQSQEYYHIVDDYDEFNLSNIANMYAELEDSPITNNLNGDETVCTTSV